LGFKTTAAWHVCVHVDVLWGDKSQIAMGCTLGVFEQWHWGNDMPRTWWSSRYPFWGCIEGLSIVWDRLGSHPQRTLPRRFSNISQV
jgi:hypothetical protein